MRIKAIAMIIALTTIGCGTSFNSQSGGDGVRTDATLVELDALYDDRISATDGDNIDYKTFNTRGGNYRFEFWFDNPKVALKLIVRDELGRELKSFTHDEAKRHEEFGPMSLPEGSYYLEINATSFASVYTFAIHASDRVVPTPDI